MKAEAFIAYLEGLKEEKAWTRARAALRRSLAFAPGTYVPAFPFVEPFVGAEEGWRREAFFLAAGLYALADGMHVEGRTLAQAMAELAKDPRRSPESVERRFLVLLDADRDQIVHRLQCAVTLVEGGLDFAQLLNDLLWWFGPERKVQSRWARHYYREGLEATQKEEVAA